MAHNPSWYDRNTARAYPLDDSATGEDDQGNRLPSHILAGLWLTFPEVAGRYAYLSSLTVRPRLVSAIILAADTPTAAGSVPLASISLRQPVEQGRQYALEALYPGAGGWIAFGEGVEEPYAGRFSTAAQGLLAPRVARKSPHLPVASAGALGHYEGLTGIVRLVGGSDLEIVKECRELPGILTPSYDPHACEDAEVLSAAREVIVFRLRASDESENVYAKYLGPCGRRPESLNCLGNPITHINGVSPDCCGVITVQLEGCAAASWVKYLVTKNTNHEVVEVRDANGVLLNCDIELGDVCPPDRLPDAAGRLPSEYEGYCSVSETSISETSVSL